jgi:hypothetical protein
MWKLKNTDLIEVESIIGGEGDRERLDNGYQNAVR